jgi:Ni/Fe-hydrogenase subunit HybB-like protein
MMAIIELALFVAPAVMLLSPAKRRDLGHLFRAALLMMFAGALYRFDTYLVAFMPGANWSYFPSVTELLITLGLVSFEVLAYIVVVRTFRFCKGRLRDGDTCHGRSHHSNRRPSPHRRGDRRRRREEGVVVRSDVPRHRADPDWPRSS